MRLLDIEARLDASADLRHLADLFDLTDGELDVLTTCLALDLAPVLGSTFIALSRTAGVTEALVRGLFGHTRDALVLPPGGALLRWRLVTAADAAPGEPRALCCDPQVRVWLSGQPEPSSSACRPSSSARASPVASWAPCARRPGR